MGKAKSHFESNVNCQRIGIMLKSETIKKSYVSSLFDFISENEMIHILMYFIETRQLGLEQESSNYGNATMKGRTSNKIQKRVATKTQGRGRGHGHGRGRGVFFSHFCCFTYCRIYIFTKFSGISVAFISKGTCVVSIT